MSVRGTMTFREIRLLRRGGGETRMILPHERRPDVPLPWLLRRMLDGGPLGEELERAVLELEVAGERFLVVRGEATRLVRLTEAGEQELAEGDERVSGLVARLAGVTEPLGRRAVARAGEVAEWLRREREGASSLREAMQQDLGAAAAALGGRIRDLLQRAEGLLQEAAEDVDPARTTPFTPEELAAHREGIAATLDAASARMASLDASLSIAGDLAGKVARRQERIEEYLRAEQMGRRLAKQAALMAGQRRALERARAAQRILRPADSAGEGARRKARERRRASEAALEDARAELAAARAGLGEQEARAAECDAVRAWIARLDAMRDEIARGAAARARLEECQARAVELEAQEREARRRIDEAEAAMARARASLAAVEASPEEAARSQAEAAEAARLFLDVRRLQEVRDALRLKAREVQLAKIAAERAEEELDLARREVEWSRESPHPRDPSELPVIPDLVAHRDALVASIQAASDDLAATRENLRRHTAELGNQAYLSPELLEAEAREKAAVAARFGVTGRDRAALEEDVAALAESLDASSLALREASAALGNLAMERLAAREIVAGFEAAVPEPLRGPGAVEREQAQAVAELARRIAERDAAEEFVSRASTRHARAEEDWRAAREAEDAASRRLSAPSRDQAVLAEAGFASWDEVEEARLDDEGLAALEADVDGHESLLKAVEEAQARGRDDMLAPRADPAQALLMQALIEHARDAGGSRLERRADDLARVDRWLDALDDVAAQLERAEAAAGLRPDGERGLSFEERACESLVRRVLERAQGRLDSWGRPWSLCFASEGQGRLLVRERDTGHAVAAHEDAHAAILSLALAVEMALAGEPASLSWVVVEGMTSVPPRSGDDDVDLVAG